jgi:hypothetical protein
VADEKLVYAIRELFPFLGQAQRTLNLDEDEYYDDRQMQSVLNWAGIPLKELTEGQTDRERNRRNRSGKDDRERARERRDALRRFNPNG